MKITKNQIITIVITAGITATLTLGLFSGSNVGKGGQGYQEGIDQGVEHLQGNSEQNQPQQAVLQTKKQSKKEDNQKFVMVKYGYSEKEADYIIDYCSTMPNPGRCVVLATHTAWHETKNGTEGVGRDHKNNLYGIVTCIDPTECWYKTYHNRMASFEDWVERYQKLWYKNTCEEMITKSRYTNNNKSAWISNCERMSKNFDFIPGEYYD